jgi:hypothetical protein
LVCNCVHNGNAAATPDHSNFAHLHVLHQPLQSCTSAYSPFSLAMPCFSNSRSTTDVTTTFWTANNDARVARSTPSYCGALLHEQLKTYLPSVCCVQPHVHLQDLQSFYAAYIPPPSHTSAMYIFMCPSIVWCIEEHCVCHVHLPLSCRSCSSSTRRTSPPHLHHFQQAA